MKEKLGNMFVRNCPSCNKEISHTDKYDRNYAVKKQRICRSCSVKNQWNDKMMRETLLKAREGKYSHWSKGMKLSEEHKEKLSIKARRPKPWLRGRHFSEEHRHALSIAHIGQHVSEETKEKKRKITADIIKRHGWMRIDIGSDEWFVSNKLHLQAYYIKELGYFVDSYDEINNTVYEYDSYYHTQPKQKEKDVVRQERIIEWFKQQGKPLKHFYRFDVTTGLIDDIISMKLE